MCMQMYVFAQMCTCADMCKNIYADVCMEMYLYTDIVCANVCADVCVCREYADV